LFAGIIIIIPFPYSEKMKVGLCNLYAGNVYPLLPTFEWGHMVA
jgi:hypothetical protein